MKLSSAIFALSISLASVAPISALPLELDAQLDAGLAPTLAQFYPGVIGAIEKLNPDAAQKVETAIKQACNAVNEIKISKASASGTAGGSIFSALSNTLGSFVNSILPNITPALTALLAVANGNAAAAPQLVSLAQQGCKLVFNDA